MKSLAGVLFVALLLARPCSAQGDLRSALRPITAPVKYGGVYHLGTGTWTRGEGLPEASGTAGILYDNTCPSGYAVQFGQNGRIVDEGRLPSPTSPVRVNAFGLGHDSEIGTQTSYTVDGFQIGYCTSGAGTVSYSISFYEDYVPCEATPALPTASFALTGLPGNGGMSSVGCWIIDIDLCASSQSFSMQADADQSYQGGPLGAGDSFGWSLSLQTPSTSIYDGYMVAGGLSSGGSFHSCSGSDGTVFDQGAISAVFPANSDAIALGCATRPVGASPEFGTGMGAQDRFRIENSPPIADGCYWFGANPLGSFHLQLYSANVTPPNAVPALPYCDPASGGVLLACPCSNPPSGPGRGCNNSAATGGASLVGTGSAALAADTLVFATANEPAGVTTILVQGTLAMGGVQFGQGVRCVAGLLRRMYLRSAVGGGIQVPGPGDPSVSARSAALGDLIPSGGMRYYFAMYRDPLVLGGCSAAFNFNATSASGVFWN